MHSYIYDLSRRLGLLGFGGGAIGNLYDEISDGEAADALSAAWAIGIRYFDTAPHYGFGLSERRLGKFLGEFAHDPSVVVSSKVGRVLAPAPHADLGSQRQGFVSPEPYESVFDYTYDGVLRSFEGSARRIGRSIDILFAHDLGRRTHADRHAAQLRTFFDGGYRAMRELREQDTVRAIGLGVNEWQVCEEILGEVDLDIVLLAGRYTLLEQDALDSFLPLCERRGVAVIIGGPFNSGILARGDAARGPSNYDYGAAPPEVIARVSALEAVCERHGVTLASAALKFPLAHPAVVSVIPGLGRAGEVKDARRWFDAPIPTAFWHELRERGLLRADAPLPEGS